MYLRSDARRPKGRHRNRMRVPGYPSNREADESAYGSHCESGKVRK